MASRILFSMFKYGLFDAPITSALQDLPDDMLTRDAQTSRADAAESIVLMKNEGRILPLTDHAKRIVVIGGHADKGVLAGGGSSLVYPKGGNAVPDAQPTAWPGPVMFYPSSPLNALRRRLPGATVSFVDAQNPAAAAAAARDADVAIVFATQWAGESFDVSLTLSDNQDAVIDAVAGANPNTVVVLETGGAVLTPWAAKVPAVLEAWYPGTAGGEALGDILTGRVNPSGHLPISFPNSLAELPHPGEPGKGQFNYTEGAAVGYKWYDKTGGAPAFPFGHGLSYTNFTFDNFAAAGLNVRFTVQNTGRIPGMSVAQIYASSRGWESPRRLVGFTKVTLKAGQQSAATVQIDPRSLADWDDANRCWRVTPGTFRMTLGGSSADAKLATTLTLSSVAVAQLRGTCATPRRNDRNRQ